VCRREIIDRGGCGWWLWDVEHRMINDGYRQALVMSRGWDSLGEYIEDSERS
jgi:hypothetical protein